MDIEDSTICCVPEFTAFLVKRSGSGRQNGGRTHKRINELTQNYTTSLALAANSTISVHQKPLNESIRTCQIHLDLQK